MENPKQVSFDYEKFKKFKKTYKKAANIGCSNFTFDGDAYLVDYAKYMIEYLEARFKNNK